MASKNKAVIFDLFETLVEPFVLEWERARLEIAAILDVPSDDLTRLWIETYPHRATGVFASIEASLEHICRVLHIPVDTAKIQAAAKARIDFTRRALVPRHDALTTLTHLKSLGHKIGLISNCSVEVPPLWEHLSLAPLVDVPIFSCAVGFKKPDQRIYQLACQRLGVMPQDSIFVDDVVTYVIGATQVGIQGVLIRLPEELTQHRPDEEGWHGPTVSSLTEVLTIIED